jgi:hypothetical protein
MTSKDENIKKTTVTDKSIRYKKKRRRRGKKAEEDEEREVN